MLFICLYLFGWFVVLFVLEYPSFPRCMIFSVNIASYLKYAGHQ